MKKRLRSTHRLKEDLMSEINVTPFVDILLVLLIAFMISAPLVTHSVNVTLPKGKTASAEEKPFETPLIVLVDRQQKIQMEERWWSLGTLAQQLQRLGLEAKQRPVYIQMDAQVPHGFLIQLMLLFRNEGFTQVGLVFEEE